MATITAKPKAEEIPEVFARTPEVILGETCDRCGVAVPARYQAKKENSSLAFCAHHIRKFADNLRAKGFVITPDQIGYDYKG